jgi:hypothetical protein
VAMLPPCKVNPDAIQVDGSSPLCLTHIVAPFGFCRSVRSLHCRCHEPKLSTISQVIVYSYCHTWIRRATSIESDNVNISFIIG